MSTQETRQELTQEDRLKAIAYQFITLYERWSEDRQVAAKQGADTAELVQAFKQQVKNFNTLEPRVREQLSASIQKSFAQSVEQVNEKIEQIASEKMGRATGHLNQAVNAVTQQLQYYEKQSAYSVYIFAAVIFLACMLSALIVGKWAVPQPYSPLSTQDLQTYENGLIFNAFWSKLSEKEQEHLLKLGEVPQNDVILNSADNTDSTDNN